MPDSATINSDAPTPPVGDPSPEGKPKTRKIRARRKGASTPSTPPVQPIVEAKDLSPVDDRLPAAPLDSQRDAALRRLGCHETPIRVNLSKFLGTAGGFERVMTELVPLIAEIDQRYRLLAQLYEQTAAPDRKALYPEDYLYLAQIRPSDFYGEVARAAMEYAIQTGILQQAMAHNDIVDAGLKMAKKPIGLQDRLAHFKATGVTPLPKGAQIAIFAGGGGPGGGQGGKPEAAQSLPTFERQMLGDGKGAAIEDADFEEVPIDASTQPVD